MSPSQAGVLTSAAQLSLTPALSSHMALADAQELKAESVS